MRRLQTRFVADLSHYMPNFFLGMTPRQTVCGISVVILTVIGHLLLHIDTALCVMLNFPLLLVGFYKPNGLPLEKWIRAWIEAHVVNTAVRYYEPDNVIYDFLWKGVIGGRKVFDPQKYLNEEKDGKTKTPGKKDRTQEKGNQVEKDRFPEQECMSRFCLGRRERRRNEENIREAAIFTGAFSERKKLAENTEEACDAFSAENKNAPAKDERGTDTWCSFVGPVYTQQEDQEQAVHIESVPPAVPLVKVCEPSSYGQTMEKQVAEIPGSSVSGAPGPAPEEPKIEPTRPKIAGTPDTGTAASALCRQEDAKPLAKKNTGADDRTKKDCREEKDYPKVQILATTQREQNGLDRDSQNLSVCDPPPNERRILYASPAAAETKKAVRGTTKMDLPMAVSKPKFVGAERHKSWVPVRFRKAEERIRRPYGLRAADSCWKKVAYEKKDGER